MSTTGHQSHATLSVPEGAKTIHDTLDQGRYHLRLGLSPELNNAIEELAMRNRMNKADVINMAVGILKYLSDQRIEGKKVGVASPGQELETEITDI